MFTGVIGQIDLARDGKQSGHLHVPHSVDRSPYFRAPVPFWRLRNGDGPSILLLGGNHGDEYEGPLAISRVLQALEPRQIKGSITAFPALNAPAVQGDARCSPLDDGNLNRSFPGDAAGGPTDRIAAFVAQEMIPRHDVVFDLHAGGTSMAHEPCALTQRAPGVPLPDETERLLHAMGLPWCFLVDTDAGSPTALGQALRAGKIAIGGEFGGGGSTTPQTMRLTINAIENVLCALGILQRRVLGTPPAQAETRFLRFNHDELFVFAPTAGWYEPLAEIGDWVAAGQPALRLWDLNQPARTPGIMAFQSDGVVLARRLHSHIRPGDCLYALGAPI